MYIKYKFHFNYSVIDVPIEELHYQSGDIIFYIRPDSSIECMYACSANDSRYLYLQEVFNQSSSAQLNVQYLFTKRPYLYYRENASNTLMCNRCHKSVVQIKNGKPLKTCVDCLCKSRKYQKDSYRRKENKTNSVICTTCNRKPAMIADKKQYHTCSDCIQKKKAAYRARKDKINKAMKNKIE